MKVSLRSMFISVTLCCLLLAWLGKPSCMYSQSGSTSWLIEFHPKFWPKSIVLCDWYDAPFNVCIYEEGYEVPAAVGFGWNNGPVWCKQSRMRRTP